tara:strand:+ start:375 stop:809 length:435 start_codon:yes stop_codon:yes gene_type:complete
MTSRFPSHLQRSCDVNNSNSSNHYITHESQLKLDDSKLTSDKNKCGKLLQARPYATTPYMGSGKTCTIFPDAESKLKMGEDTYVPKSMNSLSGITIARFEPLIDCIEKNVQDTKHIVPDHWVRGGADTRAIIKNIDYRKACLNF